MKGPEPTRSISAARNRRRGMLADGRSARLRGGQSPASTRWAAAKDGACAGLNDRQSMDMEIRARAVTRWTAARSSASRPNITRL